MLGTNFTHILCSRGLRASRSGGAPFLHGLVFAVAVFLGGLLPAGAQVQPPTPQAKARTAEVLKGETVTIELQAETVASTLNVEFVVREFPQSGTLGLVKVSPTDRSKATVTYQAAADASTGLDFFTYTVRHPGGLYSAPARVEVKLISPEARLSTLPFLDFGRVAVGAASEKELVFTNAGTGSFEGILQPPPPFAIVSPEGGKLVLPAGKSQTVRLRLASPSSGAIQADWMFQPGRTGCRLFGACFEPVAVSPESLNLEREVESKERSGRFVVTNGLPTPAEVMLITGNRLKVTPWPEPKEPVTVDPAKLVAMLGGTESREFRVFLPQEDALGFDGTLGIQAGGRNYSLRVKSDALPARIVMEPLEQGDRIALGTLQPGPGAPYHSPPIRVRNVGGTSIAFKIEVEPPFQLVGLPKSVTLEGGGTREFRISVESALHPGIISHALVLRAEPSGTVLQRVSLDGIVPSSGMQETPDASILAQREKQKEIDAFYALNPYLGLEGERDPKTGLPAGYTRSPLGFITRDFKPREYTGSIPNVLTFEIGKVTQTSIELIWKKPRSGQDNYLVDIRYDLHDTDTQAITSVWIPFPDLPMEVGPEEVRANIQGLQPGTIYEFRVVATDGAGLFATPSIPLGVTTLSEARAGISEGTQIALGLAGLAAAVFVWWRLRKKHRSGPSSTTLWARPPGQDQRL
ncbi:MAG: fibronectin type III domain-containing protein [Akkermansiaceae bacterium]|nr:fibronectin type III domain-containing protein [Akkermansiaceae bacterium]